MFIDRHQLTMTQAIRETDLYQPVKMFFEAQGYEVKSEVCGCDVVAIKANNPITIIELKTRFNLELLLQGVDRLSYSNTIYLAILESPNSGLKNRLNKVKKLCYILGFGILLVTIPVDKVGHVTTILEPASSRLSNNKRKSKKLSKEFQNRCGDLNTGGSTRIPIMTAYRQNALRILNSLQNGRKTIAELREQTGINNIGSILQRNFYGWFLRTERGVYELSTEGLKSTQKYAHVIRELTIPYK